MFVGSLGAPYHRIDLAKMRLQEHCDFLERQECITSSHIFDLKSVLDDFSKTAFQSRILSGNTEAGAMFVALLQTLLASYDAVVHDMSVCSVKSDVLRYKKIIAVVQAAFDDIDDFVNELLGGVNAVVNMGAASRYVLLNAISAVCQRYKIAFPDARRNSYTSMAHEGLALFRRSKPSLLIVT